MIDFGWLLVTAMIALCGGLLLNRLHIPSGAMLGSLVAVAVFHTVTGKAVFYDDLKIVLQIVSGAMIGGKISRADMRSMKTLVKPTVILVVSMMVLNLTFGTLIHLWSNLDIPTALFATTPGGVADMALIAEDLDADTTVVAILQLCRCLIVFCCFPPIFKKMVGRIHEGEVKSGEVSAKATNFCLSNFMMLLVCATVVGILFWQLGISAGALIGGMVGGAVFSLLKQPVVFPNSLRIGLQVFAGVFIGIKMGRETLLMLPSLWLPVLVMLVGIFLFVFVIAFLMYRLTDLPLDVCLLSSTPAGIQEMALLSEELGVDTVKVSLLHTARLVLVILLFPTMIAMVSNLA